MLYLSFFDKENYFTIALIPHLVLLELFKKCQMLLINKIISFGRILLIRKCLNNHILIIIANLNYLLLAYNIYMHYQISLMLNNQLLLAIKFLL